MLNNICLGGNSLFWRMTEFNLTLIPNTKVLYISPDGCCTRFDIYYFKLYLLSNIIDSIFKLMMTIVSSIVLKNFVSCNFTLKYYITIWQFTKTLSQLLSFACPDLLEELNESKQFWGTFTDNVLINGYYLKNTK